MDLNSLAYNCVITEPSPEYNSIVGKEGLKMIKKDEKHEESNHFKVIHTIPKMSISDREKKTQMIGNDLYEVFIRIQSQLASESVYN